MSIVIALIVCVTIAFCVSIVTLATARHSGKMRSLEYEHEHKWREMSHKETMAMTEAMKPQALPSAKATEPTPFVPRLVESMKSRWG